MERLLLITLCICLAWRTSALAVEDLSLNQKIVLANLGRARAALARAQTALPSAPLSSLCLNGALHLIHDAETHVSSQNWEAAKDSVASAIPQSSGCLNGFSSDDESGLSYLASAIDRHLKAAQNELDITTSRPFLYEDNEKSNKMLRPKSVNEVATQSNTSGDTELNRLGCSSSQVDGSKCQFSACGRDYGLVSCVIGFAKGVVGGLHGLPYLVTSDKDNALNPSPGTLRYATNLARGTSSGVWITFARSMVIVLQDMLWVQSHTTIDGRGVNVTINGRNLVLGGVQDVIIHNIQISNVRGSDTLHIFSGTSKVWVDHLTSFNGDLGLASVLQGSTDVTISNCNLQNYNFNMLLGASDADSEDRFLRVTVYRNWFRDSMQRMPHCRWGMCHVVNNLYTNWGYYAIGGRANARVRSESNVFIASRAKEVTPWFESKPATFDMSARIESKNDLLLNGTTFHQFLVATSDVAPSYPSGSSPPILPTSHLPSIVEQCAGALFGGNLLRCQHV